MPLHVLKKFALFEIIIDRNGWHDYWTVSYSFDYCHRYRREIDGIVLCFRCWIVLQISRVAWKIDTARVSC